MNWGIHNGAREHKVKARKNLTLMLFYDPTKGGITFRIPKWIRFPLMIIPVAILLGVLYTMNYIADLESQLAYERLEVQSGEYVIYNKDAEISELEITEEKRYDQLQALGALTVRLKDELESLKAYKDIIDEKLGSTEKTTDTQPDRASFGRSSARTVGELAKESVEERSDFKMVTPSLAAELDISDFMPDESREELVAMGDDFSDEVDRLLSELNIALDQLEEEENLYEAREEQVDEILPYWDAYPSVLPVSDSYITSPYGMRRNPFGYGYEFHSGIDLSAYYQDVWATGEGVVTYSGYTNGYGYLVVIDHGYGFMTKYAHNSRLLVKEGDAVDRYDVIARSGNSGRSSGPHLHYEILLDGETQNPMDYIYEGEEE